MTHLPLTLALLLWIGGCQPPADEPVGPAAEAADGSTEPAAPATGNGYPRAQVTVGMHVIQVEVADTPVRKRRGLSGRKSLGEGTGMLFPYARAGKHGFWMYDMYFDIDMVWIRGDRVVDITHGAVHDPPGKLPSYRPSEPADTVLEVPAGAARRLGWSAGDPVRVEPPIPEEWKAP